MLQGPLEGRDQLPQVLLLRISAVFRSRLVFVLLNDLSLRLRRAHCLATEQICVVSLYSTARFPRLLSGFRRVLGPFEPRLRPTRVARPTGRPPRALLDWQPREREPLLFLEIARVSRDDSPGSIMLLLSRVVGFEGGVCNLELAVHVENLRHFPLAGAQVRNLESSPGRSVACLGPDRLLLRGRPAPGPRLKFLLGGTLLAAALLLRAVDSKGNLESDSSSLSTAGVFFGVSVLLSRIRSRGGVQGAGVVVEVVAVGGHDGVHSGVVLEAELEVGGAAALVSLAAERHSAVGQLWLGLVFLLLVGALLQAIFKLHF